MLITSQRSSRCVVVAAGGYDLAYLISRSFDIHEPVHRRNHVFSSSCGAFLADSVVRRGCWGGMKRSLTTKSAGRKPDIR